MKFLKLVGKYSVFKDMSARNLYFETHNQGVSG